MFSTLENVKYIGGVQYTGRRSVQQGISSVYRGDTLNAQVVFSTLEGIIIKLEDIMSTPGDVQ